MSELSRREVYAFIALADEPPPSEIHFREANAISLSFDTHAQLRVWNALLGGDKIDTDTTPSADGERVLLSHFLEWRGYGVNLWSAEPVGGPDEPVDDPVRERLRQLLDGGTAR